MLKNSESLPVPADESKTIDERARAYMAVNCGTCHNPSGGEKANLIDLRWTAEDTHLLSEGKIIPGQIEESKLWKRMSADVDRMPPLVQRPDDLALRLIREYIAGYAPEK